MGIACATSWVAFILYDQSILIIAMIVYYVRNEVVRINIAAGTNSNSAGTFELQLDANMCMAVDYIWGGC